MSDLISRQKAIDALWAERMKHSEEMERNLETCSFALRADNKAKRNRIEEDIEIIKQLPPAQLEPNYDEWCTNCKEYDKEKHSCPRWNKVIKNAVDELKSAQPEQCEDAVSRKAVKDGFVEMCSLNCPYTEKQRHIMCGSCLLGTAFDVLETTQPVTPKQRTGKWIDGIIPNDGGGLPVIVCDQCNTFFPLQFGDGHNFCPNCGAKMMEGDAE